jgi:hypothetical protein
VTLQLSKLNVGDGIEIQEHSGSTNWGRYQITAIADNTTWLDFTVTVLASGGTTISNNADTDVSALVEGAQVEDWSSGSGVPSNSAGRVGDWYLDIVSNNVYEKTANTVWTYRTNIKGDGWIYGTGDPATSTDPNGTLYLDGNTGKIWEQQSGSWVFTGISIKGAPGSVWYASGVGGINDPSNVTNPHQGDNFIYGNSGDLFIYNAGSWTYYGNIRGPTGQGVPTGGTAGQVLAKIDSTNYNTQWVTGGGGGSGATDLNYKGSWASGSYADGDIVIDGNVAYVATKPTSARPAAWPNPPTVGPVIPTPLIEGNWLTVSGGAVVWAAAGQANGIASLGSSGQLTASQRAFYSITPPTSPIDGDEWVFPFDATNGIMWKFRYRSGSASTYKWEFVGGPPIVNYTAGPNGLGASAWVNIVGSAITVTRAGDYLMTAAARITAGGAAQTNQICIYLTSAANVVGLPAQMTFTAAWIGTIATPPYVFTSVAANSVFGVSGYSNGTGGTAANIVYTITPVRVI